MRARLGESLGFIQKFDTPIEKATTNSLDALRAFTEGRRLNSAGEFPEAIPFLERAVELDLNSPWPTTCWDGSANAGQDGRLATIKSFELRDRASELERLSITAIYHWFVTQDRNKALETYEVLKQVYPRDAVGHLLSGNGLRMMGRLEDALKENQEAVRLNPASVLMREDLVDSYFHLNRSMGRGREGIRASPWRPVHGCRSPGPGRHSPKARSTQPSAPVTSSERNREKAMTTRNAAVAAVELAALGSAMTAALVVWLLLARPLDVVDAVSVHELGGLARLAFTTFQDLLMRLLELL